MTQSQAAVKTVADGLREAGELHGISESDRKHIGVTELGQRHLVDSATAVYELARKLEEDLV